MEKMLGSFIKTTLTTGDAQIFSMIDCPIPATVWVVPASGDTVAVSVSCDGGVTFVAWDNGSVSATSSDVLMGGVTNIKFQRTAGSGTTSTCGVC